MFGLDSIAKLLVILGCAIVLSGASLWLMSRLPFLGKLPGDILISKGNVNIFIPIVTMIIISIVLTIVLNLVARALR